MVDPRQADSFSMDGWTASDQEPSVRFHYTCAHYGAFSETVTFPWIEQPLAPLVDHGLAGLLDLLQIALGVSYYKCAAARRLILSGSTDQPEKLQLAAALYREGLAEFYVRNDLFHTHDLDIEPGSIEQGYTSAPKPHLALLEGQALVAWGGGKDSYVADAIARKAGLQTQRCSVVMSDKVADAIQRTSNAPVLFLRRHLDPKLREVNADGALNGHVPITAINSLMLVILGRLTGAPQVIFANERSADEPTIQQDGIVANHQYSKSSAFEGYLRNAITASDKVAPDYYSILRPFSEIWIARVFAKLTEAYPLFTSCNRNFQIIGDQSPRWCGDCAKCAFTSLMLAPHLTKEQALTIFPDLFLNHENLLPLYRELCGLTDKKPWDCVGTINECRATLHKLASSPHWQDTRAVQTLAPEVSALHTPEELEIFWQEGLQATEPHFVPDTLLKAAHDL
ncbi:MAG: hypothetical protein MRY59_02200 [Aquisalinus sp.]|nr:hypothetical protein [Aquisalinus sp.]